jgi:hypothetical protein
MVYAILIPGGDDDVPANIPRALLPEYITDMILKRSSQIAKIRNLRTL